MATFHLSSGWEGLWIAVDQGLLLLQFLSDRFSANQVFILHCFTGSFEISKAWLTQFPKTYFGFTFLTSSFAPGDTHLPGGRVVVWPPLQ
jgi:hypothetical protein